MESYITSPNRNCWISSPISISQASLSTPESEIFQQKLVDLLQDSYGNYVDQTCLSEGAVKAPSDYIRMANLLRPFVHQLRTAPYIKRIHNLLNLPTTPDSVSPSSDAISDGHVSPLSSPHRQTHRNPRTTNGRGTLYYQTNTPNYSHQQFPQTLNHYPPAPPHNPPYQPKPRHWGYDTSDNAEKKLFFRSFGKSDGILKTFAGQSSQTICMKCRTRVFLTVHNRSAVSVFLCNCVRNLFVLVTNTIVNNAVGHILAMW